MKKRISDDVRSNRVKKMLDLREEFLKNINDYHVKLQQGNSKTGKIVYTVSLCPIIDCKNCSKCQVDCYDINNDCRFPGVIIDRAKNSAIHKADPKRYWMEISDAIAAKNIEALRINVGGDLVYEDFIYLNIVAKENPGCELLFFTKSYDDINRFLSSYKFCANVHPIISRWCGVPCDNRFDLPESHVLYDDGTTTAPEYGSIYCGGDCSECKMVNGGCFGLKNGESVIFKAH